MFLNEKNWIFTPSKVSTFSRRDSSLLVQMDGIFDLNACERTRLSLVDDIFQITNSNIVIGMPRRCISSNIGIAWGAETRFQPNCNCAVKIK